MRVLVTGGAGFIGAHVVRHLVGEEWVTEVRVLDDLSTGRRSNVDGLARTTFVEGSIIDQSLLSDLADGVDAIVHLAARPSVALSIVEPEACNEANVTGTLRVLEAARAAGGAHVLIASSAAVYGADAEQPKHEAMRPEPLSPYAASKLANEAYAASYAHCYGLPVLCFRFFNVFGPFQPVDHAYAAFIPALIDAALEDRPAPIHGDGQQTRDFVYAGSVAAVLVEAVRLRIRSPQPVNLAFGANLSLLDVVKALGLILEREIVVQHGDSRPGDIRHSMADQSRLQSLIPHLTAVDFVDGLRRTVDWFRAERSSA